MVTPPAPENDVGPGPTPTLSVIIAAHQAANVIGEALESALTQEPAPHEVVVCDDGSTDDLDTALLPFAPHVTLVRQPNQGEGAAKNTATRHASGDFVVLLDADDVFLPGRLAAIAELAVLRPDLDIITTDAIVVVDGQQAGRYYRLCEEFAATDQEVAILERNFIFGLAAVRRSRLLETGGFDERLRYTSDWSGWLRLVLSGSRVGLVDEALARYHRHGSSLSADRVAMTRGRLDNLGSVAAEFPLDDRQKRALDANVARAERALPWEELAQSLRRGEPDGRRRSMEFLRLRSRSRTERLTALMGASAPRLARAALRWAGETPCGKPRSLGDAWRERPTARRTN